MRVGDMRVGDMRVGDMRVGDMRVCDMRRRRMASAGQDAGRPHPDPVVLPTAQGAAQHLLAGRFGKQHARLEHVLGALAGLAGLPGSVACGQRRFRPQGRNYVTPARDAAVASGKIA